MGILLENVSKEYKILTNKEKSLIRRVLHPKYDRKIAVDDISFEIKDGEFVGYIGSNGAGKSTTLKMLSGILTPTTGRVLVNGIEPYKKRALNSKQIGVVFGQRSQLLWDLPIIDTFQLYKRIYKISDEIYSKNMSLFREILQMDTFINQPSRQLSLGQKMKVNIALALLHDPKILFLDEPTLGLDVITKDNLRSVLKQINATKGVTIILTTHDLSDIEELCSRLILIDNGKIKYDGSKETFINRYSESCKIKIVFESDEDIITHRAFKKIDGTGREQLYEVDNTILDNVQALRYIVDNHKVIDIGISSSSIESIVKDLFNKGVS